MEQVHWGLWPISCSCSVAVPGANKTACLLPWDGFVLVSASVSYSLQPLIWGRVDVYKCHSTCVLAVCVCGRLLSDFSGGRGVFTCLSAFRCEVALGEFLKEIKKNPSSVKFAEMANILVIHCQAAGECSVQSWRGLEHPSLALQCQPNDSGSGFSCLPAMLYHLAPLPLLFLLCMKSLLKKRVGRQLSLEICLCVMFWNSSPMAGTTTFSTSNTEQVSSRVYSSGSA